MPYRVLAFVDGAVGGAAWLHHATCVGSNRTRGTFVPTGDLRDRLRASGYRNLSPPAPPKPSTASDQGAKIRPALLGTHHRGVDVAS